MSAIIFRCRCGRCCSSHTPAHRAGTSTRVVAAAVTRQPSSSRSHQLATCSARGASFSSTEIQTSTFLKRASGHYSNQQQKPQSLQTVHCSLATRHRSEYSSPPLRIAIRLKALPDKGVCDYVAVMPSDLCSNQVNHFRWRPPSSQRLALITDDSSTAFIGYTSNG